MKKKGKNEYVPPEVIDERNIIINIKGLTTKAEAFKEMANYSKIGREIDTLIKITRNPFKRIK